MPSRCGCADNCACLIQAGAGIAVGGLGTVEDPYVIETDQLPVAESMTFMPTSTVEFRTSGMGTPESPLGVYADAKIGMRELTDVLASDVPVTGDVVTWQADHWEFRPPPSGGTVIPGGTTNQVLAKNSNTDGDVKWMTIPSGGSATVTTGNGITGDGSVGTPVYLRNSGSWVLPNFPADMAGTLGREVYVDSAGQVRAKPDVIYSTTGKTAAALISTYPVGLTVMTVTAAQGSGWPPNASCTVLTARRADASIGFQMCCLDSATVSASWYRQGTASAWSPWVASSDPLLPDVVSREVAGDINIAYSQTMVETSPQIRATITNPNPYRKMLVEVDLDSWVSIASVPQVNAVYIQSSVISGAASWVLINTMYRDQNPPNTSLYCQMYLSNRMWVDPGATVVIGTLARRLYTDVSSVLRTPRLFLTPIRYG